MKDKPKEILKETGLKPDSLWVDATRYSVYRDSGAGLFNRVFIMSKAE